MDEDFEGLLLLTTDGKVSEQVRSKKGDKEFYVQVDGIITQEAIEEMKKVSKLVSMVQITLPNLVSLL